MEYWVLEEYHALKRTNKANQASGTGESLHIVGSTTYPSTTMRMNYTVSNLFVVSGGRKRRRVYGRGKVPSRLKPPVYDFDDISTASGPVDMREQFTLLNHELTQQVEERRQEVTTLRGSMHLISRAFRALLMPNQQSLIG
ncbi:hypothetical protein PIB30_088372 [Stylosanthes scabra]|uniref:Uncharacterized protein n=1 Tax=Stylosanthes scabra TaxID=79078 RepID=A0ABU6RU36_9FABA|nr:hypothetical protein [Stylosanthes scabra]